MIKKLNTGRGSDDKLPEAFFKTKFASKSADKINKNFGNVLDSIEDITVNTLGGLSFVKLYQSEYDSLEEIDNNTVYIIIDDPLFSASVTYIDWDIEEPVAGLTVNLYDASDLDTVLDIQLTDVTGTAVFTELTVGSYVIINDSLGDGYENITVEVNFDYDSVDFALSTIIRGIFPVQCTVTDDSLDPLNEVIVTFISETDPEYLNVSETDALGVSLNYVLYPDTYTVTFQKIGYTTVNVTNHNVPTDGDITGIALTAL